MPIRTARFARLWALLLAAVFFLAGLPGAALASAYDGHPRLVVLLVIDQFRGDYLERYRADFKGRGFRLFLDKGAYFPDCYYEYLNTKTAPGHATIGTGSYSEGHGIANNEWWDLARSKSRPVTAVEDERYRLLGLSSAEDSAHEPGASPLNLHASTLGDELRLATGGQARVFGVSLKDRAAILPSGHAASAAYWVDPVSGAFITSTYYMRQLPDWVVAFNASDRAEQALAAVGAAPKARFADAVGPTPEANAYELDFAEALIGQEKLGTGTAPDLITISLSATDLLGHRVGPDDPAMRQMIDALDTQLDGFFTWLDRNVEGGLGSVWMALSADHGVAPAPAAARAMGMDEALVDVGKLTGYLNVAMNAKFSPGENVPYLLSPQDLPYLSLNRPEFEKAGINEQEAEDAVLAAVEPGFRAQAAKTAEQAGKEPPPADSQGGRLPAEPHVYRAYTRLDLAAGRYPDTEMGRILGHSYTVNGGWYVMVLAGAYELPQTRMGTTHFTPWSYDRHVPMAFYGGPFSPGTYHGRTAPVDIASTLASLLGINQPSAAVGRILTEAIRPEPPPAPARAVRVRRRPGEPASAPAAGARAEQLGK